MSGPCCYLHMNSSAAAEPKERDQGHRHPQLSSPELLWRLHLFPLLIKLISVSLMRLCSGFLLWMKEKKRERDGDNRENEGEDEIKAEQKEACCLTNPFCVVLSFWLSEF